jgi:hypothetical protein
MRGSRYSSIWDGIRPAMVGLTLLLGLLNGCGLISSKSASSVVVGNEGGDIHFGDLTVSVAKGQFEDDFVLLVEVVTNDPVPDVGQAYRVSTDSGELPGPLELTFHIAAGEVPEDKPYEWMKVARFVDGTWDSSAGLSNHFADRTTEEVSAWIEKTGIYGVVIRKPDCENRECGDDGWGGSCGQCDDGMPCVDGICMCQPDCEGLVCGDDGCSGSCGDCGAGLHCVDGACVCAPDCIERECGDDGCEGNCGICAEGQVCAVSMGLCTVKPQPGTLVLTEVMTNASAGCLNKTDWFEVFNVSPEHLDLDGCILYDNKDKTGTIDDQVVVPSGGYLVMVQSKLVPPFLDGVNSFAYGDIPNINKTTEDSITLECGGEVIFTVTVGGEDNLPMPGTVNDTDFRRAIQLDLSVGQPTLESFADPCKWCHADQALECGDFGTPGQPNSACNCEGNCIGRECGNGGCCLDCGSCPDGLYCLESVGSCVRMPQQGELVPTEFLANTSLSCGNEVDWVEVYNPTTMAIALRDCVLSDLKKSKSVLDDDEPVIIRPEQYFVLARLNGSLSYFDTPAVFDYGGTPNLNKGEEDEFAIECNGTEVFRLQFGLEGQIQISDDWSGAEGESGRYAMQLGNQHLPTVEINVDYNNSDFWCEAVEPMLCNQEQPLSYDLGTPGYANNECP